MARKPTKKQVENAMDVLRRAERPVETRSFTPIVPNQLGVLIELLNAQIRGRENIDPRRLRILDLISDIPGLPLGGRLTEGAEDLIVDLLSAENEGRLGDELRRLPTKELSKQRKPPSAAQKKARKMQSDAFKQANSDLRKKNGQLKKGKTQSDVAKRAQSIMRRAKARKAPSKGRKRK
jgi:hypothetical protein